MPERGSQSDVTETAGDSSHGQTGQPPAWAATGSKLFRRYHRIMRAAFIGITLVSVLLFGLYAGDRIEDDKFAVRRRVEDIAYTLNRRFDVAGDLVDAMVERTHAYMINNPKPPPPDPLYETLIASDKDGVMSLDSPPAPFERATIGNLVAASRSPDPAFRHEVDLAISLMPLMHAVDDIVEGAGSAYYISTRRFAMIVPWVESSLLRRTLDGLFDRPAFLVAKPEADPSGRRAWTDLYFDRIGGTEMVSVARPINHAGRFFGIVAIDMALSDMRVFLRLRQPRDGTLMLMTQQGGIIYHSQEKTQATSKVLRLADVLPAGLQSHTQTILRSDDLEGTALGDFYVFAVDLNDAPFRLVYIANRQVVLTSLITSSVPLVLALLLGLALVIYLAERMTRQQFIGPAEQLVGFIEAQGDGSKPPPALPLVPQEWRPWFDAIRATFAAHGELVAIRQELDVARRLQQAILPRRFPERPEIEIAAKAEPAKEVGGDFYDVFWLDDRRLGLVIADVAGKGVPAALVMAETRTLLRGVAPSSQGPAQCLGLANNLLAADNDTGMFVTVFLGMLDLATGRLAYANGGHNPALICRADGTVATLGLGDGLALAVVEDFPFDEGEAILNPGDTLVLYTDGVTEAFDIADEAFGDPRLRAVVEGSAGRTAAATMTAVFDAVDTFVGDAPPSDDTTVLALRYRGVS
jgi:sigma-B regulation protein RsbU (phosphoserine phosphatase)